MSSRVAARRPPGFRLAVVAGIAAIHAGAYVGLSQVRAQRAEVAAPDAVEVAFIREATVAPPPAPVAHLEEVRVPVMNPPVIDLPVEPAITPPAPAVAVVEATAPSAPEAAADEPVKVETVEYARPCTLRYPPMARRLNAQGTTIVRVLVDTEGRPQDVRVDRSSGYRLLDDAAIECARQALFKPRREGGRLRNSLVTIPFDFFTGVRTASR